VGTMSAGPAQGKSWVLAERLRQIEAELARPFGSLPGEGALIAFDTLDPEKRTAIKRAEIEARYAARAEARKEKPQRPGTQLNGITLNEVRRLARYRYGATLPDTEVGRSFAFVLAALMATHPARSPAKIMAALQAWAPWQTTDERVALLQKVMEKSWRFSAPTLARKFGVTQEERNELGLTTMRAIGMLSDKDFHNHQKARRAKQARQRRTAAGATPRSQSASQLQPWKALGLSRRQWERLGKPMSQTRNDPIESKGGDEFATRSALSRSRAPLVRGEAEYQAIRRMNGAPPLGRTARRALGLDQPQEQGVVGLPRAEVGPGCPS
jgi:hypothetical protein